MLNERFANKKITELYAGLSGGFEKDLSKLDTKKVKIKALKTGKTIVLPSNIFANKHEVDTASDFFKKAGTVTYYDNIKNKQKLKKAADFLSRNTDVEWNDVYGKGNKTVKRPNILTTSHKPYAVSAGPLIDLAKTNKIKRSNHYHTGEETLESSYNDDSILKRLEGDADINIVNNTKRTKHTIIGPDVKDGVGKIILRRGKSIVKKAK